MNSPGSSNEETQLIPTRFILSLRASTQMIYMYTDLTFNEHTNQCTYIKLYIKTFKIAPTRFDPKIIFRELHFSLLKSHFLKTLTD